MAVIQEDFIRCECGSGDFTEKQVLTVLKTVKKRDDLTKPLDADREYYYECDRCGKFLDK